MENTWQVCPKCDGNKKVKVFTGLTTITHYFENCSICNGFGIVSKETGLPPSNNGDVFIPCQPIIYAVPSNGTLYNPNTCRGVFVIDPTENPSQKFEDAYSALNIPKEINLEG